MKTLLLLLFLSPVVNAAETKVTANEIGSGMWKMTSSATVTNSASITFSGLSNTKTYNLTFNITHLTASLLTMKISGASSGYSNAGFGMDNGSGTGAFGSGLSSYFQLGYPGNTAINYPSFGNYYIGYSAGNVWVTGSTVHFTGSLVQNAVSGGAVGGNLTSIQLITSAGNMTGTAYLFEVVP